MRDNLPAGIDHLHVTAFVILNGKVRPRILLDSGLKVAKSFIGSHAGVVGQAELVATHIGLDDGGIFANDLHKQDVDACGRTLLADEIPARPLGIGCVVYADFAALVEPVQEVVQRSRRKALAFLARRIIVGRKICCRLPGSGAGTPIVADVHPKRAIPQPREITL